MSGQIEYIRSFLAVARNGGFSLAARALGLSPTIVTRHIGELEAQLGVQLFTRTTRKVDLTDAGRLYRRRVAPVVQELDAANADVRHRQIGLSGPLNVSVPMSFGLRFLPDIVAQFRTLHPGVTLRVALSDHFVDIAGEGFDLALRISRPPADLTTIWRKICQIPRVLVAAPAYVAVRGVPDDPAQLRDHTCLDYAHDDTVQPWVLSPMFYRQQWRCDRGNCATWRRNRAFAKVYRPARVGRAPIGASPGRLAAPRNLADHDNPAL